MIIMMFMFFFLFNRQSKEMNRYKHTFIHTRMLTCYVVKCCSLGSVVNILMEMPLYTYAPIHILTTVIDCINAIGPSPSLTVFNAQESSSVLP